MELLERGQPRATKMNQGLEHLSEEDKLNSPSSASRREGPGGTWREREKPEPGSPQQCPVPGQEAQTGAQEVPQPSGSTSALFGWWGTGTGCPEMWNIQPWRSSKAAGGGPAGGQGKLQRSPPTSGILQVRYWSGRDIPHCHWLKEKFRKEITASTEVFTAKSQPSSSSKRLKNTENY